MNWSVWFRGLRGRLLLILVGVVVTIGVLVTTSHFGLKRIEHELDEITVVRMPSIKGLEAMNEGQTAVLQVLGLMTSVTSKDELLKLSTRYREKTKQINDGWALYEPLPQVPEEAEEWKRLVPLWKKWEELAAKAVESFAAGDTHKGKEYYQLQMAAFYPSEASLGKIIQINYTIADQSRDSSKKIMSDTLSFSLLLGVVSLVVILFFGLLIASRTATVLTSIADTLNNASNELTSAARNIASSSEELAQANTEQAASTQQTTAAVEEMNSIVQKNADNARSTAATSTSSQKKAERGKEVVEKMSQSMDDINASNVNIMHQINESNDQIANIVKVIQEIGDKTKVINDIVFQTKLLSFNASVEAARAGEHGKGFAVVAEEVGKLAQMSGNASKEISVLLNESIRTVKNIVEQTKTKVEGLVVDARSKVESGTQVARQCGVVLDEIVQDISSVKDMAEEISSATGEQTKGIQEISRAINQLDQVTQQNAANSQISASSAEELAAQAESVRNVVAKLLTTVQGNNGSQSGQNAHQVTNLRSARA